MILIDHNIFLEFKAGCDKGLYIGMILIDHNIFLEKLKCRDFSEKTIALYRSYLDDRHFKVNVEDPFADQSKLACNITTGCIL